MRRDRVHTLQNQDSAVDKSILGLQLGPFSEKILCMLTHLFIHLH